MSAKPEASSQDLIRDLVHQFTDPFAFYRELIQNAIDAGSSRIEVLLNFRPGADKGLATARIQDWGEGMTRDIIEKYLLTKFRSSKENDLTKIGKFGIGFMSLFAPNPELVVVDTGRDGEYWRILFHPALTYELFKHPEPIEGTSVTLHKQLTASEYESFVQHSERAVRKWCRHSEADVAFSAGGADGKSPPPAVSVRQPFVVDAPFQVEHREEGTHVIAGPARVLPAQAALYNRGLTLLETEEPLLPGITFKIVSRYLEHTLTRDNVIRDKNFEHAMSLVKGLVEGSLLERLPAALEQAAREGSADYWPLFRYAATVLPDTELWFRTASGKPVPGAAWFKSMAEWERVFVVGKPCALSQLCEQAGLPVLLASNDDGKDPFLEACVERWKWGFERLETSVNISGPPQTGGEISALGAELTALLPLIGVNKDVGFAPIHGELDTQIALELPGFGKAKLRDSAKRRLALPTGNRLLCFNVQDPRVMGAFTLGKSHPRLAALLLTRLYGATHGLLSKKACHRLTEASLGP